MDIVAYGEYYNKAMQGITDMLLEAGNPLASFKKDRYPEAFQAYLRKHLEVLDAVEQVYQAEEEKNEGEVAVPVGAQKLQLITVIRLSLALADCRSDIAVLPVNSICPPACA